MLVTLINSKGSHTQEFEVHEIVIELDNTNMVTMFEVDPGTIQIRNTTEIPHGNINMGILLEPIDVSTINITPEG